MAVNPQNQAENEDDDTLPVPKRVKAKQNIRRQVLNALAGYDGRDGLIALALRKLGTALDIASDVDEITKATTAILKLSALAIGTEHQESTLQIARDQQPQQAQVSAQVVALLAQHLAERRQLLHPPQAPHYIEAKATLVEQANQELERRLGLTPPPGPGAGGLVQGAGGRTPIPTSPSPNGSKETEPIVPPPPPIPKGGVPLEIRPHDYGDIQLD